MWPTNTPSTLTRQHLLVVANYLINNQKIHAIKELRGITNLSLKEAKDVVDLADRSNAVTGGTYVKAIEDLLASRHGITVLPDGYARYGADTSSRVEVPFPDDTREILQALLKAQWETNELLKDLVEVLGE